jgi:hypothetical protein
MGHTVRQLRIGPEPNRRPECCMTIRAWGKPLPNIGGSHSRILDRWTATQAAPKAPQRKRPCRSRALVLDPNRSFVELRVREPRQGLVAFRHLQEVLNPIRRQLGIAHGGPLAAFNRSASNNETLLPPIYFRRQLFANAVMAASRVCSIAVGGRAISRKKKPRTRTAGADCYEGSACETCRRHRGSCGNPSEAHQLFIRSAVIVSFGPTMRLTE